MNNTKIDKILLLQVEKNKLYDKDGNDFLSTDAEIPQMCPNCKSTFFVGRIWYTGMNSDSIICSACTITLNLKEVLEAQLFRIKLEEQRHPEMEIPRYKQRSERDLAEIEDIARFIYEGFAHYDEVTSLYRRPYWTDLCNSDKERWYHTAEWYQLLSRAITG